jgi:hypothetical protein
MLLISNLCILTEAVRHTYIGLLFSFDKVEALTRGTALHGRYSVSFWQNFPGEPLANPATIKAGFKLKWQNVKID